MPDSKISALPSGIPAQAGDQFPIARSGLNYSLTPVTLASAFTNLGAWQAVQTSSFTAAVGKAYPINTTSAAITVTLPSSATRGDVIYLADYAGTFATNNLTIQPNFNGYKLNGSWAAGVVSTNRAALQLVYSDATQGWLCYTDTIANLFAEGFTIQGLVVAGGGSGGSRRRGGGGGAGGFRTYQAVYPASPSPGTIETGTVTVGAGASTTRGTNGSNSVLNTITSAGGGAGGYFQPPGSAASGTAGGSGGGGTLTGLGAFGGAGNTPATVPSQGNPGAGFNVGPTGGGGIGGTGGVSPAVGGKGGVSILLGPQTSTTSLTIVAGSQTLTIPTGLNYTANEPVRILYDSSNYMDCTVTSYNSGTGVLVVNAISVAGINGSGTYSSWVVHRIYAGGGGGPGQNGTAGGGAGDSTPSGVATPGTANTGGGGGGKDSSIDGGGGGGGGSGVVLISIPNTGSVTFSGGVTSTMTTVGTKKVYTVTATSTTSETYTVTVP